MRLYDFQKNMIKELLKAFKEGHKNILICSPCGSGKTYVMKYMIDNKKEQTKELLICHRKELKEQHKILLPNTRIELPKTAYKLLKNKEIGDENFIINDEVHLALAKTWNNLISYYKKEDNIILGFSATPERLDGKPFGDIFTKIIKGPSVDWLISNNYLSPFKYLCPQIPNLDNLSYSARTNPEGNLAEYTDLFKESAVFGDVIKTYNKFIKDKKTIIYCINKKHAKDVAEAFNKADIPAGSIDSDNPKEERSQIMKDFISGKIKVLCNCAILSEGISINDLEAVILLRPTSSYALFIQQSMRPMRKDPKNKEKIAYIIDMVNNFRRHGLPNEEYDFKLNQSKPKKQELDENGDFYIRYCKNCFQAFEKANKCPYCNYTYELDPREIKAHEEIEIAEITEKQLNEKKLNMKNFNLDFRKVKNEIQAIELAQKYGYKPYYGITRWRKRRY